MAIYLDKGTNVNAAWTQFIAVSKDGVNWETINKNNLIPIARLINENSDPQFRHPAERKGRHIHITLRNSFSKSVVLFFDPNEVVNQATWQGNDLTAMNNAVADLSAWISA